MGHKIGPIRTGKKLNLKELATFIEIDAKPDVVWNHMAAFRHYPEWNPFILAVDGHPMVGERLTLTLKLQTPDGRNQANHVITPVVTKVEMRRGVKVSGSILKNRVGGDLSPLCGWPGFQF
jgi:hypothetical protein